MSFIDLSHNSILGNEVNPLIELKSIFCSNEEGKNVNIKVLILEGKIGIRFAISTPNAVNNDMYKNFNFFIGISRNSEINTASNAFLEVVKKII